MDQEFVIECLDLIDEAESKLLTLKESDCIEEVYNTVFRVFHSIKGSSSMLGEDNIQAHFHKLEFQLEIVNKNKTMNKEVVDYFLDALDYAKILFEKADVHPFNYKVFATSMKQDLPTKEDEREELRTNSQNAVEIDPDSDGLIYIVDDEKMVLESIRRKLVGFNFTIKTFTNPLHLLEALEENQPDLIISDFYMPEMNGHELYLEVKKRRKLTSFVMITGSMSKELLIECFKIGITGVLEKPVREEDLIARCFDAITRYRTLKALDSAVSSLLSNFADVDEYLASKGKLSLRDNYREELKVILVSKQKINQYKIA